MDKNVENEDNTIGNTHNGRKWHELPGKTPEKDQRMEMTKDNFYRVIAMRDEVIMDMKEEISKLKQQRNKLQTWKDSRNEINTTK